MLDVQSWRYFKFTRIFKMENGFYNKKPESSGLGNIPFIGATDKNNGVTDYFTLEEIEAASKTGEGVNQLIDAKLYSPHALCVTNNGSVGYAYYQDKTFTCSHDVNPLYRIDKDFNRYTALFVATVIMHDQYRWGYGRKWRPKRMKDSVIKLPVMLDESNNPIFDENKIYSDEGFIPDWDFMESYVKSLNPELPSTNNCILKNDININNWKCFKLLDLDIDIYKAKANVKADINFSKYRASNMLPFVSRTELNNSVDGWTPEADISGIESGNALVIGDTTATISYQPDEFLCGDHIVIIRASWLNKFTGLFIQSLLNKEKYRYSYGRAFKMDLIKNTILSLPVNTEGNVDWDWIESYMKSLPYADII